MISGKAFAIDQTFPAAALQYRVEKLPQQVALAEAAMPVLREGQMVWHRAVKTPPA